MRRLEEMAKASDKKLRLLVVNDNHAVVSPNGKAEFPKSKFHLFLQAFTDVDVCLSSPLVNESGASLPDILDIDGVRVLPRPAYGRVKNFAARFPVSYWKQYRALKEHIALFQPEAVLLVWPSVIAPVFYYMNLFKKIPLYMYIVGNAKSIFEGSSDYSGINYLFARAYFSIDYLFVRKLARTARTVFVLGREAEQEFRKYTPNVQRAMTSLITQADIVNPGERPPIKEPVTLLTVSRLSPEKGIDIAFAALDKLIEDGHDLQYIIAGDGAYRSTLEAEVMKYPRLSGRVRFLGWVQGEELEELYRTADIFLFPSTSEGIPKVLLEAMAKGLPIVTTDAGGIPDVVDETRGWIARAGDVETLVSSIKECLSVNAILKARTTEAYKYISLHTKEEESSIIQHILIIG